MSTPASYIFASYSFIHSLPEEQLLYVGNFAAEGSPIPSFDENLLIRLCEDAEKVLQKDENIIEMDGDVIIVGDIHGSLHDLLRILRYIDNSNCKVICLGDYVDRGNFSLECITLLFCLKVLKPDTYYLLRGNHEFNEMSSQYGFKKEILNYHNPNKTEISTNDQSNQNTQNEINFDLDEVKNKKTINNDSYFTNYVNMNCYKYSEKLYDAFDKAFSYLPFSAIVNKTSICLHGGLTPLLDKVENIEKLITRPISSFDDNNLLCDIVWGDPSTELPSLYGENQRGRGKLFNGAATVNFLRNNNLKRVIRGHQCVNNGVEELFNEKCITVFSASSYNCDMGNSSGILKIYQKDDKIEPITFPPITRLQKYDATYYKVAPFERLRLNQPPMLKISEFKSGFISSMARINSAHSELLLMSHFHTSHRQLSPGENDNNIKQDVIPKQERRKSTNFVRNVPLRLGPRRKSRVLCAPQILTPQISKQNSELPKKFESDFL